MRAIGKWVAVVAGVVAALMAIAAVVIGNLDVNCYRGDLEAAVKAATGRDLRIDGELTLTLGTPLALAVDRVTLANAPWGSRPAMAVVDHAEMDVALLPLLERTLRIDRLTVHGVDLLLETDAAGAHNWQFTPASAENPAAEASSRSDFPLDIRISEVDLANVRWSWRDATTRDSLDGTVEALSLQHDDAGAPINLALTAEVGDAPVTANGTIGPLRSLLAGDTPYPLSLTAAGLGMTARVEGKIAKPLAGEGLELAIKVEGKDVQAGADKAGVSLPALPPFSLSGHLSDPQGGYEVSGLEAKLGGSDAAGDVRVDRTRTRPNITAKLTSQQLDLAEVVAMFDDRQQPAADPALPFAALRLADATIDVTAGKVILQPGLSADNASFQANLSQGKLTANLDFGGFSGGTLTVGSTWDASNASMSVRVLSEGVEAGTLLRDLQDSDALRGGPLKGRIELAGRGQTLAAWLAGVDGRTDLVMGPATQSNRLLGVFGADVVTELIRTINPFVKTEETTPITCGVLRSKISRGRMTFDRSVALETNRVGVIASGSVDLPSERIDIAMRSAAREGLGISVAGVVSMFVSIGGTLDHPKVQANPLGGIADIARFATSLATSAVTLDASGILRLLRSDGDYCQVALGETPASKGPIEAIGDAAKDAAQGVGRRIESLFGD